MKVLITGAAGQLGQELQRQLQNGGSALGTLPAPLENAAITAVDLPDADLSKLEETRLLMCRVDPDVVLNCAAFTNVDRCETEWDTAFAANAIAPRNLAITCEERGAKLVHVSTDYVFRGNAAEPLSEAERPDPCTAYGKTKLMGDEYVQNLCRRYFVVRTAWLYGRRGNNFVKTILRLAKENGQVKVVNDQVGNPTNAEDLAHHLLLLAAGEEYGLYHCTGKGICSWFDFAKEILRLAESDARIEACSTEEFPRPAPRPAYSALDHSMLRGTVGDGMRPWRDALAHYMSTPIEE